MQYTVIFHGCKNVIFQMIFFNIFLIFAQNIDCGYTLEPPTEVVLTSTHNLCFEAKIKKKVYPCKPQFYYIKVGCKGVFFTQTCFRDGKNHHKKLFEGFNQIECCKICYLPFGLLVRSKNKSEIFLRFSAPINKTSSPKGNDRSPENKQVFFNSSLVSKRFFQLVKGSQLCSPWLTKL